MGKLGHEFRKEVHDVLTTLVHTPKSYAKGGLSEPELFACMNHPSNRVKNASF